MIESDFNPTKEEVDSILVSAGYNPAEMGKYYASIARLAMKNAQLESENARLRAKLLALGETP